MAGREGFEPTTHGFGIRCSTVGAIGLQKTSAKKQEAILSQNRLLFNYIILRFQKQRPHPRYVRLRESRNVNLFP
jgi:hypothetical protein